MFSSTIPNVDKYFDVLYQLLVCNNMITEPEYLIPFVKIRTKNGQIIAWEIDSKNVTFSTNDCLKCEERAVRNNNVYEIKRHSYHFNPSEESDLYKFRIDLERSGELHLNPDPKLEGNLGHRMPPSSLSFSIENFNSFLAIHLVLLYLQEAVYPGSNDDTAYETKLNNLRRCLE